MTGRPEFTTFTILCKIYLPKPVVERLDRCFSEFLTHKINFPTLSQQILQEVSVSPNIARVWTMILQRNPPPDFREYRVVFDTVTQFQAARAPLCEVLCFFSIVVDCAHSGAGMLSLVSDIADFFRERDLKLPVRGLLSAALELYPLIPRRENPPSECQWLNQVTSLESLDRPRPYVSPPRPKEHEPKKRKETQIGNSYVKSHVELSEGFPALVTNSVAKSCSRGSEGTYTESTGQYLQRELRSILFERLEAMEIADNAVYAMLARGERGGILLRRVLKDLYGDDWIHVGPLVKRHPNGFSVVDQRVEEVLPIAYETKMKATLVGQQFLESVPRLNITNSMVFSTEPAEVRMAANELDFTTVYLTILFETLHTPEKSELMRWFVEDVASHCLPHAPGDHVLVVGGKWLANTLCLYGEVSMCLRKLIRPATKKTKSEKESPPDRSSMEKFLQERARNYQPGSFITDLFITPIPVTSEESDTQKKARDFGGAFDAAVEAAVLRTEMRYLPMGVTEIAIFLRSALAEITNERKFETIVEEAQVIFGARSKHFYTLTYVYTKLLQFVEKLRTTEEWEKARKARCESDFDNNGDLDNYCNAVLEKIGEPAIVIEMTGDTGKMMIREIECSVKKD